MASSYYDKSWKNFLPQTYNWTNSIKPSWSNDLQAGYCHIIATTIDSNKSLKLDAPDLSKDLQSKLTKQAEDFGWTGKSASITLTCDDLNFCLVPICQTKSSKPQISRQFGIDVATALKSNQVKALTFCQSSQLDSGEIFEGYSSGLYDKGLFKGANIAGNNDIPFPEAIQFTGTESKASFEKHRQFAKGSAFARMLQDAPANWLDPIKFSQIAKDISKDLGLKCSVEGTEGLKKMGAGSFLSVAAGSNIEPQLITIEIDGEDNSRTVALVGKGLTFDSGGTSLKPSAGMGEMKYDMSGGSAVLAAAMVLGSIKPKTKVVCIIGAVENMIGPEATRPGDIVVAMNGKSIDVQNTDAEGRLVLADCLCYAQTFKPEAIIDVATLTGACLHALGHSGAAMMSNKQSMADKVINTANEAGEPFWQLPLWPELEQEVKGEFADLNNIAKPNVLAGSIIGGIFLSEFVDNNTNWAHLDIAGTGWSCKATGFPTSGGSGYALRTMSSFCL